MDDYRDFRNVLEVFETPSYEVSNAMIGSGDWKLLEVAAGHDADGIVSRLYILGRPYKPKEEPIEWLN